VRRVCKRSWTCRIAPSSASPADPLFNDDCSTPATTRLFLRRYPPNSGWSSQVFEIFGLAARPIRKSR
ncbi:unnamed protein product, partial [Nesidiocoris tenuis]